MNAKLDQILSQIEDAVSRGDVSIDDVRGHLADLQEKLSPRNCQYGVLRVVDDRCALALLDRQNSPSAEVMLRTVGKWGLGAPIIAQTLAAFRGGCTEFKSGGYQYRIDYSRARPEEFDAVN